MTDTDKLWQVLALWPHPERITQEDITELCGIDGPVTRKLVSQMRHGGRAIGSDKHGYYVALRRQDMLSTLEQIANRRAALDALSAALHKTTLHLPE